MKELRLCTFCVVFVIALCIAPRLHATYVYPFEIFTNNGDYNDSPDFDAFMEVYDGVGQVNFKFYNVSSIESSLEGIYFDNGSLLGIAYITEGPGTSFSKKATPSDFPGGNALYPAFEADLEFSVDSDPPIFSEGVNPPDEWLIVTFDLINGGDLADVVDELNTGVLRVGVHVIGLPDGSSESALAVPEPGTVLLLGLGVSVLLRKHRAAV